MVRAVHFIRAISAVLLMITAPTSRHALSRLAPEIGSLASVFRGKETTWGLVLALGTVLVSVANPGCRDAPSALALEEVVPTCPVL